jgi:hypothetical protein
MRYASNPNGSRRDPATVGNGEYEDESSKEGVKRSGWKREVGRGKVDVEPPGVSKSNSDILTVGISL